MIISIDDFKQILTSEFTVNLTDDIVDIITDLTLRVSAPNYIKTPTFSSDKMRHKEDMPRKKKKYTPKHDNNTNSNSQSNIVFKIIAREEKSGPNKNIECLRSFLNRITKNSYNSVLPKIMEELDEIFSHELTDDDIHTLHTHIFNIVSNNRIYSEMYANIYVPIVDKHPALCDIFWEKYYLIKELFNNFEYVDGNDDYERFCQINKSNEHRRSIACFLINLYKKGFIEVNLLTEIITDLTNNITETILLEGKDNEVNEMCELVSLLYIKKLYTEPIIVNNTPLNKLIASFAQTKNNLHPSLKNKSIFKFMDIAEREKIKI